MTLGPDPLALSAEEMLVGDALRDRLARS